MVHLPMTFFVLFTGLLFAYIFDSIELLILIICDVVFRLYGFICILTLYSKFKSEEDEIELANASQRERLSSNVSGATMQHRRSSVRDVYGRSYSVGRYE